MTIFSLSVIISQSDENSAVLFAAVAEQADARDLKSLGVTTVSVQIRSAAPNEKRRVNPVFFVLKEISSVGRADTFSEIEG